MRTLERRMKFIEMTIKHYFQIFIKTNRIYLECEDGMLQGIGIQLSVVSGEKGLANQLPNSSNEERQLLVHQ